MDARGTTLSGWHHMHHVEIDVRWLSQGPQDLRRHVCRSKLLHSFVGRLSFLHIAGESHLAKFGALADESGRHRSHANVLNGVATGGIR